MRWSVFATFAACLQTELYEALLAIHALQSSSVNLFGVMAMALDQKSIRHSEADGQFVLQLLARQSLTPDTLRGDPVGWAMRFSATCCVFV